MKNLIIVIYIGVEGISIENIPYYVKMISEKITPQSINGEIIIIPIQSKNTKVECINPRYVTKKELINENNELIKNLNIELQYQLEQLKNKNNE